MQVGRWGYWPLSRKSAGAAGTCIGRGAAAEPPGRHRVGCIYFRAAPLAPLAGGLTPPCLALQERQHLQRAAEAQAAAERAMVDEVVTRIAREDELEADGRWGGGARRRRTKRAWCLAAASKGRGGRPLCRVPIGPRRCSRSCRSWTRLTTALRAAYPGGSDVMQPTVARRCCLPWCRRRQRESTKAFIAEFLEQQDRARAQAKAAAAAEERKIQEYWQQVGRAGVPAAAGGPVQPGQARPPQPPLSPRDGGGGSRAALSEPPIARQAARASQPLAQPSRGAAGHPLQHRARPA
jgi:hypothetical protein